MRTQVVELIQSRLATQELRLTSGRRRVADAIAHNAGPRTAAELYEALRDEMPLSSLYRSLTVLAEAGVLVRSHNASGVGHYELAEWLRGHHHHLVCLKCGEVQDVDLAAESERDLDFLAERIASGQGFRVSGHRLDVEGICGACAVQ